ncbi:MAG: deoxyguanosinetriphosphate triphosphohydrolase [Lachnospiraceae bacterium]|nr:deoxyguanosinetriphosphate triphosphohydrolase [Lachnospiraceae bacterium]
MEHLSIREQTERREHQFLSRYAAFSDQSLGRDFEEEKCDMRTCYQRDRDRILHCKSFRRLKHKTQVFLAPEGDHYRTRLTHTLEVAQIARTIAKSLSLNEELTEAIALGHDLGHTPFGHAGERTLNAASPYGFRHNEQSIRVVEVLERDGRGMNLTKEVRDGILNHKTTGEPMTLEGKIVRLSDKIAYINHDIDDAIRGHIMVEEDIPKEYTDVLGCSIKQRLNTLIHDIIENSLGKDDICMSERIQAGMYNLRKYMFASVYTNPEVKGEEKKAEAMIMELYNYYLSHKEKMPKEYKNMISNGSQPEEVVVCDYIAGMTDQYSIETYKNIKIPVFWVVK